MGKKLELTPRLRMVADMLPENVRLADVGTDHAYLPAALMLEGMISFAIAAATSYQSPIRLISMNTSSPNFMHSMTTGPCPAGAVQRNAA